MRRTADTLALAVGLAHAVPGAVLVLRQRSGRYSVVSSGESADINICDLRRVLITSACPAHPDPSDWVEPIELQGSVRRRFGGIYQARRNGQEERWFAVRLRPEIVYERLARLEVPALPRDGVEIVLKPDAGLGLTNVCVTVEEIHLEAKLDDLAMAAYSACLVEELAADARVHAGKEPSPDASECPDASE